MDKNLQNLRKQAYYMNIWPDLNLQYSVDYQNTKSQIVQFFKDGSKLVYPAKSFFVAIIYAKCMEKWFNVDFIKALDDPELLPDDRFYIPYSKDKETYDYVLNSIGDVWQYQSINKTVEFFKKEFLICNS